MSCIVIPLEKSKNNTIFNKGWLKMICDNTGTGVHNGHNFCLVGLGLCNNCVMYIFQCVWHLNNQSFRLLSCAGELYSGKFLCQHPMSYVFVECCTGTVNSCAIDTGMYRDTVIALLHNTKLQALSHCCFYRFRPKNSSPELKQWAHFPLWRIIIRSKYV